MSPEWWSTFSAHLAAIVLGGLKVMIVGWLLTWFIRKKYLGKIMAGVMRDMYAQLGAMDIQTAGAVPSPVAPVAAVSVEPFLPPDPVIEARERALLSDYKPLPHDALQGFLKEMREKDPKTQAEILAIAGNHGLCWDSFGRLIRIPRAE